MIKPKICETDTKRLEQKMDKWLNTKISLDNIYQATFALLEAVPEDVKKSFGEDGCCESGGWRYKKRLAEIPEYITAMSEGCDKERLWRKHLKLIEQMYFLIVREDGFPSRTFVLGRGGHLELLLGEVKKKLSSANLKKSVTVGEPLWYLRPLMGAYLDHYDKLALFSYPERIKRDVEIAIELALNLIDKAEKLNKQERLKIENNPEICDCVIIYIRHGKKIPKKLLPVAEYMIRRDEVRLEDEKKNFEEATKHLRENIRKIRGAL
ncbi:MAG: hypothetical protein Q7R94_01305 [bacterium]|nr:hypothetical protein [bacterium]